MIRIRTWPIRQDVNLEGENSYNTRRPSSRALWLSVKMMDCSPRECLKYDPGDWHDGQDKYCRHQVNYFPDKEEKCFWQFEMIFPPCLHFVSGTQTWNIQHFRSWLTFNRVECVHTWPTLGSWRVWTPWTPAAPPGGCPPPPPSTQGPAPENWT